MQEPVTDLALRCPEVSAGTLTEEQKEVIVHHTTDLYAEIYGDRVRPNTMVLVEEVADGGWGIGGDVLTLALFQRPSRT